jgi:hypothetical protein
LNVYLTGHKTKSRSQPDLVITGEYDDQFNGSGVLQTHNPVGDYTVRTTGESIVYTGGRRNVYAKSNYCYHKKETFSYGGRGAMRLSMPSPAGWYADYRSHHHHACTAKSSVLAAAETALSGTGATILGGNAQAFINSAFDKLRPDLTTVDIPNFLLELDDVASLFKLWKKKSRSMSRKVSIAKNVAGAHLNYKFGWKPTIGDIGDAINGVVTFRNKLAAFRNAVGKTIQVSTNIPVGLPTSANGTLSWPSGSHQVTWSASCTRSCQAFIAYKPQLPAVLNEMEEILAGFLDSLGFELNPRIIWEAIPFSFVIDWFFGVGTFLQRLKIDTLELPINLVDGWVQYKETYKIEWSWLRANDGTYVPRPKSDNAVYERNFFHRVPIYPDYASLAGLGWKMPTFNQALLGVSLATVLKKF